MASEYSREGTRLPETPEVYPRGASTPSDYQDRHPAGPPRDDLLEGAQQIAHFLGVKPRKIYAATSEAPDGKPRLPVFRIGRTLYARKSKLREWIERQENEAM